MAIESVSSSTHNVILPNKPVAKPAENIQQQPASPLADVVNVSRAGLDFKSLQETAAATPSVNVDKVETLKAAVQSGNYKPNPERIAAKLLQFEHQLSNTT